jgi:signal transduction histidine kinase
MASGALQFAMENARLHEQAQETAISEERARIAREMHDSLAQMLYYVNTQAGAALTLIRTGHTERATEHLEHLAQMARDALADVREDILALHAASTMPGLLDNLASYLPRWQEQSGVRAELCVTAADGAPPALAAATEIQLVRIVQEALANVRKHANARHVQVRIGGTAGQVAVLVEDDGVGFDVEAQGHNTSSHFGLATMRERAAAVGGRLEIDSAPGRGTRVIVHLSPGHPS